MSNESYIGNKEITDGLTKVLADTFVLYFKTHAFHWNRRNRTFGYRQSAAGTRPNGERLRPENGYPMRLFLPGFEGNTHIKWLRRLQVSDRPFMTREETFVRKFRQRKMENLRVLGNPDLPTLSIFSFVIAQVS